MNFGEFITHAQVWPFTLVLILFVGVCLLEILLVFTGFGGELGLDISMDIDAPGIPDGWTVLDWLGLGKVPYLVSLAAFMLALSIIGLFAQALQFQFIGAALPWPVIMVGAGTLSMPLVRIFNRLVGRVWPKDVESSAITTDSLIGHECEVVLGTVTTTEPGQVRIRDAHGAAHHHLAYADVEGESYPQGSILLVVGRRGAAFSVIRHPNPSAPANSNLTSNLN